jgi:plasmid stabilization system protein ParE
MKELFYSDKAISDLERLREFIAEHNPQAAASVAKELIRRVTALRSFPLLGVRVEEAPDPESIRDFVFGNYVVRYLVSETSVCILRIWHHYEDR